jgi:basic membrane protein A
MDRGCPQPTVVCVGLVTGYGSVKAGIERQAWLALQDSIGGGTVDRIDYIETVDTRDRAANIAYFADSGYDIVVTTGAGIMDATIASANLHPDALFVAIQPGHEPLGTPKNLVKFEFKEEQGGFLAGAAAAMITRTHRVAAVCESRFIDYIERYCEGFAAGAKFVNEETEADIVYHDGPDESLFHDTAWGTAMAAQVVEDGADVVFAVGETTAQAALIEAAKRGALVIGAQVDLIEENPEIRESLVTSAIVKVREGLALLILERVTRQLGPGPYPGQMGLAPFHAYEGRLAPGLAAELLRIEADLRSGSLIPNVHFEAP